MNTTELTELIVGTYADNLPALRNALGRIYTGDICGQPGDWLLHNLQYNIEWPMLKAVFVNMRGQQHPYGPCNLTGVAFCEFKEPSGGQHTQT